MKRHRDALGRFEKAPPPKPRTEYRIVTIAGGQVTREWPWRDSERRAMDDAVNAKVASYDETAREWYLAVPVSLQKRKV